MNIKYNLNENTPCPHRLRTPSGSWIINVGLLYCTTCEHHVHSIDGLVKCKKELTNSSELIQLPDLRSYDNSL